MTNWNSGNYKANAISVLDEPCVTFGPVVSIILLLYEGQWELVPIRQSSICLTPYVHVTFSQQQNDGARGTIHPTSDFYFQSKPRAH